MDKYENIAVVIVVVVDHWLLRKVQFKRVVADAVATACLMLAHCMDIGIERSDGVAMAIS